MKKLILLWVLVFSLNYANEIAIDRTGYHVAIGGTAFIVQEVPIAIPMLDFSLEYGLTPQSTLLLEHHGYIIGGLMVLEYKYYMDETQDSFYLLGGPVGIYALDYGAEVAKGVFKGGVGYAWNYLESDLSVMGDNKDLVLGISLRYKF